MTSSTPATRPHIVIIGCGFGGLEAAKALEAIKKTFPQARTEAAKKRVIGRLEQFARQHAETEAADEARQILDQAAANRPR